MAEALSAPKERGIVPVGRRMLEVAKGRYVIIRGPDKDAVISREETGW